MLTFSLLSNLLAALALRATAQPSPEEMAPLYRALANGFPTGKTTLERRVPLSTNDDTVAPLIDLMVYAPPIVPQGGLSCTVELLRHDFGDGSYNNPAVVEYNPPTAASCGKPGDWAAITLNLTVYS